MAPPVQFWDWEKDVLRQLLYTAPDGDGGYISIRDAAKAAGHEHIHPDKLQGFSKKMVLLGYGQAEVHPIQVPSIDIDFRLSPTGHSAAIELAQARKYQPPAQRLARLDWSAAAAVVSAIAAIISAIIAYQVAK